MRASIDPHPDALDQYSTATTSEAILAVSRLQGIVARGADLDDLRAAFVAETRSLLGADGVVLLAVEGDDDSPDILAIDPPDHAPASGWRTGSDACLLVPVHVRDGIGQVLGIDRPAEPFTDADQELAWAFAAAGSGALEHARLAQRDAERMAQFSALARAARTLNENVDLSPLLTAICTEARAIMGADAVAIYLRDDDGGVIAEAADGLAVHMLGYRMADGEGLAGRVAQEGRSMATSDYQSLANPAPGSPVADVRSALAVPMRWDDALRGVLSVGYRSVHAAGPEELRLLETFGDLAAAACRNANAATGLALAARTDELTGCLNRAALLDGLRLEVERCARTGQQMTLVMLDLDEFKQVNELHGHLVGDEVLRHTGHALRTAVRPYDLCARYGGDEFVIVCSDASEQDAAEVATRAMERLTEELADVPGAADTGVTAGIAPWAEGRTATGLLEDADRALLYGKQQGRRREIVLASELPTTFRPVRFRRADDPPGGAPETGRQAERLQKRSRQLVLASALGTRLAGMREARALVEAAADELHRAFGYLLCSVIRLREDGLVEAATARGEGFARSEERGWTQPSGAGVIGRALRERRAVVVPDVRLEAGYKPTPHVAEMRSELVAPIWVGGRLWGAIDVEESRVAAFDDEDARLVQIVADQLGAALRSAELYNQLENAYLATADALSAALDARDARAPRGDGPISGLCEAVGIRLGMKGAALRDLRYGAALHDIGKIAVPETILDKPGDLDPEERAVIERHPLVGEQMLSPVEFLAGVAPLVRHEHERWDGTGYPDGLAGERIPLGARIIFACDAYRAMVSVRPYRESLPEARAREELRRNSGSQFDPAVVGALLEVLDDGLGPAH